MLILQVSGGLCLAGPCAGERCAHDTHTHTQRERETDNTHTYTHAYIRTHTHITYTTHTPRTMHASTYIYIRK